MCVLSFGTGCLIPDSCHFTSGKEIRVSPGTMLSTSNLFVFILYMNYTLVRVVKSRRMRSEGACGAYGGGERGVQGSGGET